MATLATMQAAPSKKQAAANKKAYEQSRSIWDNISDWWKSQKNKGGTNVAGYIQRNYDGSGLQKITGNYNPPTQKVVVNETTYTPTTPTLGTSSSESGGYSRYGGSSSGGSGGVNSLINSIVKPDISGLLAAYDQQAESAKKTAQNTYDTTRNDLLTSLKRFQEQNAKDVENQRQNYLSAQSSLDVAREQANRQNRIAASSRGLGGSGLQQLAQLQTLMAQGEDISNAASSNQKAMDALRSALQQREDDYNTNLAKAQTTLDTALNNIDSNLAQQKAKTIFDVEQDYANTLNSLLTSGGSGGGSGRSYGGGSDAFDSSLESLLNSFNAELATYGGKTEKEALKAINKAYGETYGNAKNLNQAKTILNSAFADAISSKVNKNTTSTSLRNAINQGNVLINNLGTTKKVTTTKKKK